MKNQDNNNNNQHKTKMKNEKLITMECGELIAAIAGAHYSNPARAKEFHKVCGEHIGGFTGVWLWLRDAAIVFDAAINNHWEDDEGDYIQIVANYVDLIVNDAICHPESTIGTGAHRYPGNDASDWEWVEQRAIEAININQKWETA